MHEAFFIPRQSFTPGYLRLLESGELDQRLKSGLKELTRIQTASPPSAERCACVCGLGSSGGTQLDLCRPRAPELWDSRANVFVFTEGARHGPTANGCTPGFSSDQSPDDD